jgi:tRNA-dihydrouridine synthase
MHGKPDVSFTEFTHVHDVCRGPEFLLDSLIYHEAERPIIAQLYGKEPDLFYQAAHAVCELGFDGLDINMGCPSRSVASSGSGAGLIRTPDVAQAIMQAARQGITDWAAGQTLDGAGLKPGRVAAIWRMNEQRKAARPLVRHTIPLSVKTRLGYDVVVVDRWIEHLLVEQPAVISLHGRTLQQMYRGEADWNAIARAVEIVRGSGTCCSAMETCTVITTSSVACGIPESMACWSDERARSSLVLSAERGGAPHTTAAAV